MNPFIMQSTESLVLISLNKQLLMYGNLLGVGVGDLAIGSMSIMSNIVQNVQLPLMDFTQGAQPIISYNYGARQMERVKQTFKILLIASVTYTGVLWLLLMTVPPIFVSIFNKNPDVMKMTTWRIRIFFAGLLVMGIQMACQQTFLALGQAKISVFLALLRKIILLIPLIFILPSFMENQLAGVFTAEPIADILAALITFICFIILYKKTFSKREKGVK